MKSPLGWYLKNNPTLSPNFTGHIVTYAWNPKQPVTSLRWMFGQTTISHLKIWNRPIETTIYKWMFQVQIYIYVYTSTGRKFALVEGVNHDLVCAGSNYHVHFAWQVWHGQYSPGFKFNKLKSFSRVEIDRTHVDLKDSRGKGFALRRLNKHNFCPASVYDIPRKSKPTKTLPLGRIGNPESMDQPEDQPLCLVDWIFRVYIGVSKNRGKNPKMDDENNGKPWIYLGGKKPTIFGNTRILDTSQNLWLLGKPTILGNPHMHPGFFFAWDAFHGFVCFFPERRRLGRLRLDGPHDQGLTPSTITRRKDLQKRTGFLGGDEETPGGVHQTRLFFGGAEVGCCLSLSVFNINRDIVTHKYVLYSFVNIMWYIHMQKTLCWNRIPSFQEAHEIKLCFQIHPKKMMC